METIILIASNILFLLIGAGLAKGKSPSQIVQEHKDFKARIKENEDFQTMMDNIDAYDGTGIGQRDI